MDPSARLAADGLELDRVHPQIMEVLPLFLFLSALFGLRVGDARGPSLAHTLPLEGFINLGLLHRRTMLLTGHTSTALSFFALDCAGKTPTLKTLASRQQLGRATTGRRRAVGAYLAAHEPVDHASSPIKPAALGASASRGAALRPESRSPRGRGTGTGRRPGAVARAPRAQRSAWAEGRRRAPGAVRPTLAWRLSTRGQASAVPHPAPSLGPVRVRRRPDRRPRPGAIPPVLRARVRQRQA